MKTAMTFLLVTFLSAASASAQAKVIHFKKLQECLPTKELKGLKRMKPSGSTQTAFGMTTSEASVRYQQEQSNPDATEIPQGDVTTIEIKISDVSAIPFGNMAFAMDQDFENERENGYEKSTLVKGKYKGREEATHGEGYKNCKLTFGVANKFMVSLEATGIDDAKVLHSLVESMDMEKLEKLTP